jgi:signal transduction histidine kinase
MDKRAVSSMIKACGIFALVLAAAFAGRDALQSVEGMHEADLLLVRTRHNLNDLTLTLLHASQARASEAGRTDPALTSLERDAGGEPALLARLQELEDRVQAYRAADPGARAEQAARISVLVAAIGTAAERRAAEQHTALSVRLYAALAAAGLTCLLLGALGAAWRGSRRPADNGRGSDIDGGHAGLLRQALDSLPFAMSVVDRNGQPVLVNAAARALWDGQHDPASEWRRADLEMRSENRALFQALSSGSSRGHEAVDIVAQDGTSQCLIVTAVPLRDPGNKVDGAFALYIDCTQIRQYASIQDAIAQPDLMPVPQLTDQADGEGEEKVQPPQVFLLDQQGVIVAINQPALEANDMNSSGANYLAVCDDAAARGVPEGERIAAGIRAVMRGDAPTFSMEYVCRDKDSFFWSRATVSRMVDSTAHLIAVVHENITQHKATELALRESALSMRELAEHQESVREEERKRIAREIHDELGQQLLALKIDVSILQGQLSHVPEATAQLEGILRSMSSLMQSMRSIINDLRPAVLDLGLHAAVEWQTREFQRKTGISCSLMSDGEDIVLSDACATALFRTLQESLTNVSRHASASHVGVQLYATNESLLMRVSDDGIGRLGQQDKPDAFGLRGMRERIGSLGGRLTVTAAPDQGVTVTAVIPMTPGLQVARPGFDRRSATDRRARVRTP